MIEGTRIVILHILSEWANVHIGMENNCKTFRATHINDNKKKLYEGSWNEKKQRLSVTVPHSFCLLLE